MMQSSETVRLNRSTKGFILGERGYVLKWVRPRMIQASSKYLANSLPLSVWSSSMRKGQTSTTFRRKSAALAEEWLRYVPAQANFFSTSKIGRAAWWGRGEISG